MSVNALQVIRPLTQEERIQATNKAKEAVRASYGNAPEREDYVGYVSQMTWVDKLIWLLCIVVLVSAFVLSAMRLYFIGYETFLHSIADENSAKAAGAFIVILAETTQVISALALAKVKDRKFRLALHFVSLGATAIAIVGNLQVVKPFAMTEPFSEAPQELRNPFAWLEALLPPLFVLAMAHVLKHQLLDALAMHEAQKTAYERALQEWQRNISRDASMHPEWSRFYANALRDALSKANGRTKAGKDALPQLTVADWRALVYREMQAENWYANMPTNAVSGGRTADTDSGRGQRYGQGYSKRTDGHADGRTGGQPSFLSAVHTADGHADGHTALLSAVHDADGQVDGRGHGYGQGYTKQTDARTRVWTYLEENPTAVSLKVRELAERTGVGKSVAAEVLRDFKAQNLVHVHSNGHLQEDE